MLVTLPHLILRTKGLSFHLHVTGSVSFPDWEWNNGEIQCKSDNSFSPAFLSRVFEGKGRPYCSMRPNEEGETCHLESHFVSETVLLCSPGWPGTG